MPNSESKFHYTICFLCRRRIKILNVKNGSTEIKILPFGTDSPIKSNSIINTDRAVNPIEVAVFTGTF